MFTTSTPMNAPPPPHAVLRARLLGAGEAADESQATTGERNAPPRLVEQRILPCPNLWSRQRCLQSVVDMGALSAVLTSEVPGLTAGVLALQPSMARFGEAMLRGCFIAEVIGQLALDLQRSAGAAPGKDTVAVIRGRRGEIKIIVGCGQDAVAMHAFTQALAIVASLCASARPQRQGTDPGYGIMRFHGGSNSWQRRRELHRRPHHADLLMV